jgi:SAM-dependent methyltransferase
MFRNLEEEHTHSLETLNYLYEYDEFMESIRTMVDLGCGQGADLEWWATRTTRGDYPKPLDIQCYGIDMLDKPSRVDQYKNINYQQIDFEKEIMAPEGGFDVLWCHNAFQYALNPIQTLANWWNIASPGAMLCLALPQTTNFYHRELDFIQGNGCYYHYTIVNLIHMLAVTGWDCRSGFFKKVPNDVWLHAIVYKSQHSPMDIKTTTWHDLSARHLLPNTADISVYANGFLKQKDLVLPWLDKNLYRLALN